MSRMHYLRTADNGEPSLWWSWQDLRRADADRDAPAPTGFCTHGRAWLRSLSNGITVEWSLLRRQCHASIEFSTVGDEAITVALAIPYLFAVWLSIQKAKWIERLPGVRLVNGDYNGGERTISVGIHDAAIWWHLWINRNGMRQMYDWRDNCFRPVDFLLGKPKHSRSERQRADAFLAMPEGMYKATVVLFTSTWTRPRWPWGMSVERASVEIEGGVPVPGHGDNDWDLDDDAIFSGTYPAPTVEDALSAVRASAMRQRQRHGGDDWAPAAGWPAHCLRG